MVAVHTVVAVPGVVAAVWAYRKLQEKYWFRDNGKAELIPGKPEGLQVRVVSSKPHDSDAPKPSSQGAESDAKA